MSIASPPLPLRWLASLTLKKNSLLFSSHFINYFSNYIVLCVCVCINSSLAIGWAVWLSCQTHHRRVNGLWLLIWDSLEWIGLLCNGMQSMTVVRISMLYLMFILKCIKSLEYPQWFIKNESAANKTELNLITRFYDLDSPFHIILNCFRFSSF